MREPQTGLPQAARVVFLGLLILVIVAAGLSDDPEHTGRNFGSRVGHELGLSVPGLLIIAVMVLLIVRGRRR